MPAAKIGIRILSEESVTVGIDYPARLDRRTHIERICRNEHGESPAWLPRAARWHPSGADVAEIVVRLLPRRERIPKC